MNIRSLLPGVQKNVLLKNYTTFRIGGPAKYFFVAKTKEDLIRAVKLAKKLDLPFFILGGGSNLLVSDKGYRGLIINFQFSIFNSQFSKKKILVGAGTKLSKLVNFGLEWAAGIPGTVGGAVYGNAGAFGKSMEDVVESVEVFDIKEEKIKIFKNKDCQFGYRDSIFKHANSPILDFRPRDMFSLYQNFCQRQVHPYKFPNLIILSAKIKAKKSNPKKIKQYLDYKRKNQPLNFSSAGSIFKNFQFSIFNFQLLVKKFPALVQFKDQKSIPVAFLISECGLKGKKIGKAKISEKHSNFIVNLGNAKARDVKKLINLIKKKVKNKFGIDLEEEIQYLGFKNQKLKTKS